MSIMSYVYALIVNVCYQHLMLPAAIEFGRELITFFWIMSFIAFYHR